MSSSSVPPTDPCSATLTTSSKHYPTQDGCRCPYAPGCGPPTANATFPFTANVTQIPSNGSIKVTVRNTTSQNLTYLRNSACPLDAWAQDGRQLWTLCGADYFVTRTIEPGAVDDSFFWRAVECLEGESNGYSWRCTKEQPLAPGVYRLRQEFCVYSDCPRMLAGLEVEVV